VTLLYAKFLVAGKTENKGILVSQVPAAVFGHLDGSKTPDDLVAASAYEHQKRTLVEDV